MVGALSPLWAINLVAPLLPSAASAGWRFAPLGQAEGAERWLRLPAAAPVVSGFLDDVRSDRRLSQTPSPTPEPTAAENSTLTSTPTASSTTGSATITTSGSTGSSTTTASTTGTTGTTTLTETTSDTTTGSTAATESAAIISTSVSTGTTITASVTETMAENTTSTATASTTSSATGTETITSASVTETTSEAITNNATTSTTSSFTGIDNTTAASVTETTSEATTNTTLNSTSATASSTSGSHGTETTTTVSVTETESENITSTAAPTDAPTGAATFTPTPALTVASATTRTTSFTVARNVVSVTTLSTTASTLTITRIGQSVTGLFIVAGIDYDKLVGQETLRDAFEATVKAEILGAVGQHGEEIALTLLRGSVIVKFDVFGAGMEQSSVLAAIGGESFQQQVIAEIEKIDQIDFVTNGQSIGVQVFLDQDITVATTAPPSQNVVSDNESSSSLVIVCVILAVLLVAAVAMVLLQCFTDWCPARGRRGNKGATTRLNQLEDLEAATSRRSHQEVKVTQAAPPPTATMPTRGPATQQIEPDFKGLDAQVAAGDSDTRKVMEHVQQCERRARPSAALMDKHNAVMAQWQAIVLKWTQFLTNEYAPEKKRRDDFMRGSTNAPPTSTIAPSTKSRQNKQPADLQPTLTFVEKASRQKLVVEEHITSLRLFVESYKALWEVMQPDDDFTAWRAAIPAHLYPEDPGVALEAEARLLRQFCHPLLACVEVKPYDVLGAELPAPKAPIDAVVVDMALATKQGEGQPQSIYSWLGHDADGTGIPHEVRDHFNTRTGHNSFGRAKLHTYQPGQSVIHVRAENLNEVHLAVSDLSIVYQEVLTEFYEYLELSSASKMWRRKKSSSSSAVLPTSSRNSKQALDQPPPRKVLRLPVLEELFLKVTPQLQPHTADLVFASLSVACAMLAPAVQDQLKRSMSIEICCGQAGGTAKAGRSNYADALKNRLQAIGDSHLRLGADLGRVGEKDGSFDWVRQQNSPLDRLERLSAMLSTVHAASAGGYSWPDGTAISLSVDQTVKGTRIVRAQQSSKRWSAKSSSKTTQIVWAGDNVTVMDAAIKETGSGKKVVAVSAASAYNVGGGVLSGGRHALEESWCITSTLLPALQQARWDQAHSPEMQKQSRPGSAGSSTPSAVAAARPVVQHIPCDGCLLSPNVTLFRASSKNGYAFKKPPTEILGVCSLAMFNLNRSVKDSPVDAPRDRDKYCAQVKQKFSAALTAARDVKADALICPDIGCGVFGNDPVTLGALFGQAVAAMQGSVKEVMVTGNVAFFEAARMAASGEEVELNFSQHFRSHDKVQQSL